MNLNADFSQRAAVHPQRLDWTASPIAGVKRKMLDRIGDEIARATTIVRYDPHSRFSPHIHTGGEEFLVMDGVFQDEHGDFPVGSYVRNPPQSHHTPGSEPGCTIFVKLWQFDLADRTTVRIGTNKMAPTPITGRPGVLLLPLFHDTREEVRLEIWNPGLHIEFIPQGGIETLVLEGSFEEAGELFEPQSWLRLPAGVPLQITAGPTGARVWIKEGHLLQPVLHFEKQY